MELVKLFMLKHADAEPVIINNITFAAEHAAAAQQALGPVLVEHLEVLVRTLLVLQEVRVVCFVGPHFNISTCWQLLYGKYASIGCLPFAVCSFIIIGELDSSR